MIQRKIIRIAVIAAGKRARTVVRHLLNDSENHVKIVSCYDPDREVLQGALEFWGVSDVLAAASYEEAIRAPGVDWVMVFSPNAYHKEHILAAFAAGKKVFSEKPLATSIADCLEICRMQRRCDLTFATGFVLRYSPLYRKVKELLVSGKYGTLLSIDANENIPPYHGGYIMANWRRHTKISGPHILEKCCHDLDLLNWFCDSLPRRVASFGGRRMFTAANGYLLEKYGRETFRRWWDPAALDTPFTDDNDLKDHQISIIEYSNHVQVMFQATMCNAIPERRMYFSCTEGTIIAELYSGKLRCRGIGDEAETVYDFGSDGHGDGDNYIMKELYDTMLNGTPPRCSGLEGLNSAVLALALDEAANTGKVVNLDTVYAELKESTVS